MSEREDEIAYEKLDDDLATLREAIDTFILKHEDTTGSQVQELIDLLKNIKVAGVLKSQEDFDYYTTSTDYYDSNC